MSSKKQYSGSGNGLAASKKIIDAMKGEIDYSSCLGEGSSFWALIPMSMVESTHDKHLGQLNSVLVVDDNSLNRTIASTLLKKLVKGVKLDSAENGAEAVDKIHSKTFDIVLMDCQMPVMDGYEAVQKVRQNDKELLIMAVTAASENSDYERCIESGMNTLLSKPVTMKKLKNALEKWFDLSDT
jgi:CheY-like chemotaxis protein